MTDGGKICYREGEFFLEFFLLNKKFGVKDNICKFAIVTFEVT